MGSHGPMGSRGLPWTPIGIGAPMGLPCGPWGPMGPMEARAQPLCGPHPQQMITEKLRDAPQQTMPL